MSNIQANIAPPIGKIAVGMTAIVFLAVSAVWAENVPDTASEREVKLERVPPTEPTDAIKSLEIAAGFRVELVAAEPDVVDPVAAAFDEQGRLYVVEMRDYSEQDKAKLGRVRLLSDEDKDGRFETSQVFADQLSWPTAVICFDGGVFVGCAPDILYLKDHDGDGVADERRVVFTGFGRGNVQGLVNSFEWGLDNRIYGATSSSGGRITRPDSDAAAVELRGRDFAFDPLTLELQPTTGGGQHGQSFNRWGDRFVCHNSDHLQAIVFEERYLARNPYQAIASARRSIAADGPQATVYRASPIEQWRIARTKMRLEGSAPGPLEGGGRAAGYFTSATGVRVYEGGLWKDQDPGIVYVADVGSNLVHRKRLVPDGVTYRGERIDQNTEFLRSTDIWFRPVQMVIGPEGALYVLDMYRETIEHPASLPPELKSQLDLTSGNDRGRIYRIVPADFDYSAPELPASCSPTELVAALESANLWRRQTAMRLLYERGEMAAIEPLKHMAATSERPEARIAALYAINTLLNRRSGADQEAPAESAQRELTNVISAALTDVHPQVQRHALRLAEPYLNDSNDIRRRAMACLRSSEPVVQFQLALSLGECESPEAADVLAEIIVGNTDNRDVVDAALTSMTDKAGAVLERLVDHQEWVASTESQPVVSAVVAQIVRQRRPHDLDLLLKAVDANEGEANSLAVGALLRALSRLPQDALAGNALPNQLIRLQSIRTKAAIALVHEARAVAADPAAPLQKRVQAIANLALSDFEAEQTMLSELLTPQEPSAIHQAVIGVCAEFESPDVAELVLQYWQKFAPAERRAATELLLRRAEWAQAMVRYFQNESVPLTTLDPAHVVRVLNYPSPHVRDLARQVHGQAISADRQQLFEAYRERALAGGDASRGEQIFDKNCATCHLISQGGQAVGPNLASMVSRGAESILFNILAPSGEVEPRYMEYVVTTSDGEVLSGIIAGETSSAVTLRTAENKTVTVLRVDIEVMQNTGKSIMPEGFEKVIDQAAMADLLSYLQQAAAQENAPAPR